MKQSVLVYARPWNRDQFLNIAQNVWPNSKLHVISDHAHLDSTGFYEQFRKNYRSPNKSVSPGLNCDITDIIMRCRLLRSLSLEVSVHLVESAFHALERALDAISPTVVLTIIVDNYIQHILAILAKRKGIKVIGLIQTFLNGYFRVSTFGEYQRLRDVEASEIQKIKDILCSVDYKPSFIPKSYSKLRKQAYVNWAKNLVKPSWFSLKRSMFDALNYHAWSTEIVAKNVRGVRPIFYHGIEEDELVSVFDHKNFELNCFLPLQFSPEATIDYASEDRSWINYEKRVDEVISSNQRSCRFIVKEHPNALGLRSKGFYKRISGYCNVGRVCPGVRSKGIVEHCDAIVVCTGSVGFEAAIRGKQIFTDSNPFYLPYGFAKPLSSLSYTKAEIDVSDGVRTNLVRHLLEGALPGTFVVSGRWRQDSSGHQTMVRSLQEYCKNP